MKIILVEAVVIRIDKARSALAIIVTRLEAVPPGAHPTNIRPDASGGLNLNNLLIKAAESGIIVYCAINPTRIYCQDFATLLKS